METFEFTPIGVRAIKIIKSETYTTFTMSNPSALDDQAVATFRAFYPVGALMIERVQSDYARNTMLEILETLTSNLKKDCTVKENQVSLI